MTYLFLFLWILFIMNHSTKNTDFGTGLNRVLQILCLVLLVYFLIIRLTYGLNSTYAWNIFFSHNKNSLSCFILCLLPFGFNTYNEEKFLNFFIKGFAFIVVNLLFLSSQSVGAYIVFLSILTFRFFSLKVSLICLLTVLIGFLIWYFSNGTFVDFSSNNLRALMIVKSIEIFEYSPFFGIGFGNWPYLGFSILPVTETMQLQEFMINKMDNHNVFFNMLSELGFVGTLIYLVFSFLICLELFKSKKSNFRVNTILIFFAFNFLINFYHSPVMNDHHFGVTQFLAFTLIACYMDRTAYAIKIKLKYLVLLLSFVSCLWFIYSKSINYLVYSQSGRDSSDREKNMLLDHIHLSTLKGTAGKKVIISSHVADNYLSVNDSIKARDFYKLALSDFPNDFNNNLKYSEFIFRNFNKSKEAINILTLLKSINESNTSVNLLLAEIYLKEIKFENMLICLNAISDTSYSVRSNLLRRLLYLNTSFLDNYFHLNQDQRSILTSEATLINRRFDEYMLHYGHIVDAFKDGDLTKVDSIKLNYLWPLNHLENERFKVLLSADQLTIYQNSFL